MERSPVPDISPPSPPPPASATAPADTPGPSYTAQHSPEYVHVSTRELAGVMDAVRFQLQYPSQSLRQSPRSLRDSGDTRHG